MDEFISEIKAMTTEYGVETSNLVVSLAIELYSDMRNYPSSYTEERKLEDMMKNKSKIAMAAVEIDAKYGVEGQTSHSENGINRSYGDVYVKAYKDVVGYVSVD
jgi:hypothetical protein